MFTTSMTLTDIRHGDARTCATCGTKNNEKNATCINCGAYLGGK